MQSNSQNHTYQYHYFKKTCVTKGQKIEAVVD